ncbi:MULTISPECIES: hypothetical protein [Clostridium]|uniref:hypothetical protein n=1 Tax=Clostridium TaxID=1485 RepID=UPI000E006432|nr:hypothetical protein [Clostridium sporogenes]MCW6085532.1 hypothetical protein [Clostridium sporogenes]STC84044.1 Zn-finger containing protein [Clostridium botulinum]
MLSIYSSFLCKSCKNEFVLLTEELENTRGYLVCPYCSSRKIKKENVADNLKECMSERSYRRIKGALRQR